MPGLFGNKNGRLLGIDIGATSIRLVELSRCGTGLRLDAYAIEPLPPGVVVERNLLDTQGAAQVLSRLLLKAGTALKEGASAVGGAAVISKTLELESGLGEADTQAAIMLEAEQYIPYPLEDVAIDFEVLACPALEPGRVSVLLAACRKADVQAREALLALAGLRARVVESETDALERALARLDGVNDPGVVAVVDAGISTTTLSLVREGRIVQVRELLLGAFPQGGAAVEDFQLELSQQVSRALQAFMALDQATAVEHLVLTGEMAAYPGLVQGVGQTLGLPALVANPFHDMALGDQVDACALATDAPALMVACGLAMRSFD